MADVIVFKKKNSLLDFFKRMVPPSRPDKTPKSGFTIPGPRTKVKDPSSHVAKVFNQRPDDRRMWHLWMSTYDLPAVYTAYSLRIFSSLQRWPQSMRSVCRQAKISDRAGESLLGHLVALDLLVMRFGRLSLSPKAKRAGLTGSKIIFGDKRLLAPVRVEKIIRDMRAGKLPFSDRLNPDSLQDIFDARFSFPFVVACQRMGVFEAVAENNLSLSELSRELRLSKPALAQMIRKLVGMKFLFRNGSSIGLTEISRCYLLKSSRDNWLGIFSMMSSRPVAPEALLEAVRSDSPNLLGKKLFESHEIDSKSALIFARHMHSQSAAAAKVAAETPVFDGIKHLADIGGGWGTFPLELAKKYRNTKFTIVELRNMAKLANARAKSLGLSDRVGTEIRNFFKPNWPKGADAFLFSNIFHDWSMDVNKQLASHAFAALPSGGRIILHEMILDESKTGPHEATGFSLCMVLVTEGRQYTKRELRSLLGSVGFRDISFTKGHGPYFLVVGRKR